MSAAKEDIYKTAITRLFGMFEFVRISLILINNKQTFLKIFHGLNFVFVYVKDNLITS